MSNKSVFQEKNARLNVNNTDLANILSTINGLPEAGSDITLQEKTVTPSTSTQNIVADSGYTGLNKVTVNAVTSSIDSDIKATNIRSGVNILGVTGTLVEHTDPVLQTKTVTSSTSTQTVTPDSGYDGLSKVTVNAIATATQATPSISVSSSGLITASATQTAGYVSAGTKSATTQLTTKAATTYTPTTSDQTIASGTYLTGTQTIKGDSNLIASNIRSGKSIFGVVGTLVEGTTEDLSTPLNTQGDLIESQESKIATIISELAGKAAGGSTEIEDGLIERTTTGAYVNDRITTIGNNSMRTWPISSLRCNNVTSVAGEAIRQCPNLETVYLPKCTTLNSYCLGICPKLKRVELDSVTSIAGYSFYQDAVLEAVVIRTTSKVCSLGNVNAFTSSAVASGTGYVYVPDNLVDSYKAATNWSTYANQIKGLSELSINTEPDPY